MSENRPTFDCARSRKTIAQKVKEVMHERKEVFIWVGAYVLLDQCAERLGKTDIHPLVRNQQILNALEYSRDFEKGYIQIETNIGHRKVRCFKLLV